ncbi:MULTISPECIES: competence type IV pilus minor pilin ComGD [unclassified Sporosarcina]|uniref:competence type IV pilus minor pilin ComGD n=1 Tax=unclassified Sporosarcina TaxID=2647733 RepID=UPI00203C58B6|nr:MULTISPECIES: competence type IV pilus minor pilin ComGD [unclassified Sporosarcina]GKV64599.1 hypothetical protein NCCP2331_07520 [Sporosarcina sp. NCCP-2331]GLB54528.1 hypothetical protein NCCP2378_03130 [Sporosarcina sp. NCCP-2378]
MKFFKRQNGFTFVELLLVLSILVVLTAVILPYSEKKLGQITEEDALKAFMAAVHEVQLYAITHEEDVRLYFSNGRTRYSAYNRQSVLIVSGQFPEGMARAENTDLKELYFQPSGMMNPTGEMTIRTKYSGPIKITFQFERGRMLING